MTAFLAVVDQAVVMPSWAWSALAAVTAALVSWGLLRYVGSVDQRIGEVEERLTTRIDDVENRTGKRADGLETCLTDLSDRVTEHREDALEAASELRVELAKRQP